MLKIAKNLLWAIMIASVVTGCGLFDQGGDEEKTGEKAFVNVREEGSAVLTLPLFHGGIFPRAVENADKHHQ